MRRAGHGAVGGGSIDDLDPDGTRLRVHGLEGLRIVDASVIPRLIRGHTHAATTMLAERAAQLLASGQTVAT